jgi:hypothetical protein
VRVSAATNDVVEVNLLLLERSFLGEGPNAGDYVSGAVGVADDAALAVEQAQTGACIGDDGAERLIDLVGNRGRKAALAARPSGAITQAPVQPGHRACRSRSLPATCGWIRVGRIRIGDRIRRFVIVLAYGRLAHTPRRLNRIWSFSSDALCLCFGGNRPDWRTDLCLALEVRHQPLELGPAISLLVVQSSPPDFR